MSDDLCDTYTHNLDERGRLAIPSKLRGKLGDVVHITLGYESCLTVYPQREWQLLSERVKKLSPFDPEARNLRRFLFGGAVECEIDKQGRILIPAELRAYAQLTNSVTFVGAGDYVEIWDTATWLAERSNIISQGKQTAINIDKQTRGG